MELMSKMEDVDMVDLADNDYYATNKDKLDEYLALWRQSKQLLADNKRKLIDNIRPFARHHYQLMQQQQRPWRSWQ